MAPRRTFVPRGIRDPPGGRVAVGDRDSGVFRDVLWGGGKRYIFCMRNIALGGGDLTPIYPSPYCVHCGHFFGSTLF